VAWYWIVVLVIIGWCAVAVALGPIVGAWIKGKGGDDA
jgi:hypothetical protein